MLPKANRLAKKKDFDNVFSAGKSVKTGFLIAKIANNQLSASRFGFVVSKKVSSKAVVRNKLRRRLRDSVGHVLKQAAPKEKHADVVILALPSAATKEYQEIKTAVADLLRNTPL